jgi:NADH-quinone oxidoreductase subunit G/NADP-reducing hydrogenase subunit HndD
MEYLDAAIADKSKIVIAQIAPAVRVSIGELFGFEPGTPLTDKIVGALKKAGVDFVFDTSFGADIVTMEETKELEERLENGGPFPLINSCCAGTVLFLEHAYPELVHHMASVKSPMETEGILIKTYFAEKKGILKENIFSVAIMPCVIKKSEAQRQELRLDGKIVVDSVITTVELAQFLKERGIDLNNVEEKKFDSLLGEASGAGQIYGSSGGVCEAALRNYSSMHGIPLEKINAQPLRGEEGAKTVEFSLNGKKINVLVINCLRNAAPILSKKRKLKDYQFIEIMACSGGCVGGSGQPPSTKEIIEKRRKGLYLIDERIAMKTPAENPAVKKAYEEFLGKPGSEKAVRLLHTVHQQTCTNCF